MLGKYLTNWAVFLTVLIDLEAPSTSVVLSISDDDDDDDDRSPISIVPSSLVKPDTNAPQ